METLKFEILKNLPKHVKSLIGLCNAHGISVKITNGIVHAASFYFDNNTKQYVDDNYTLNNNTCLDDFYEWLGYDSKQTI